MKSEVKYTSRLVLRSLQVSDLDAVAAIWGDPENGKYLADEFYQTGKELAEAFGDSLEDPAMYYFAAAFKGHKEIIGTCSAGSAKTEGVWSIGYTVRKDHWGKGIAQEMVAMLIDLARQAGAHTIISTVAQENTGSNRVMEKCGFQVVKTSSFRKGTTDLIYPSYQYELVIK